MRFATTLSMLYRRESSRTQLCGFGRAVCPLFFFYGPDAKKGSRAYAAPSRLGTLPQVLRQTCYCIIVNAWLADTVVTGVAPLFPASKRITPSSVEQKSRVPVTLKLTGEVPVTNEVVRPPAVIPVAANTYPLLPALPGIAEARTLSSRQAVAEDGEQGGAPPRLARSVE